MHSKKQGNGIFVVLIILTALAFGIYSVFSLINGELRLNKKAVVYNEAKQTVESLLQSGATELSERFSRSAVINPNDLLSRPLTIDASWSNFYVTNSNLDTTQTDIRGGIIQPPFWTTINPQEPGYESDELGNVNMFKRAVELLAKATVDHPVLGPTTAYASYHMAIRDVPLFAYAIFYNMPMEIAPGARMEITGPVHANGDTWVQANAGLDFKSLVTIAGDLSHGRRPEAKTKGLQVKYGPVNVANDQQQLVNMKRDSSWPADPPVDYSEAWLQSSGANFFEAATLVWNGNLRTQEHDVDTRDLPGTSEYIEDTNLAVPGKQQFNSAYPIIQPILNEIIIPANTTDSGYNAAVSLKEIERQKFSYLASLTIEVDTTNGTLNYFTYQRDANNDIIFNSGAPVRISLNPPQVFAEVIPYTQNVAGNIVSGLYDNRQEQNVNIVELDIEVLKNLIHAADGPPDPTISWGPSSDQDPRNWWRGIVYIQFPQAAATSSRPDGVNPAADKNWGVKLVNGGIIPNPDFAQAAQIQGTTIATNQMMYVKGHYNADGIITADSSTQPDNYAYFGAKDQEAPAALVADAITFLSGNWQDANSKKPLEQRIPIATEVSAAIITGVVPSGNDGTNSYSGGVENLPRFLEFWDYKVKCAIRGSSVALYECEVATERWGKGNTYKAPIREWGFHRMFGEGLLPPGTPFFRNYRGRLQMLSQDQYNARSATLSTGLNVW